MPKEDRVPQQVGSWRANCSRRTDGGCRLSRDARARSQSRTSLDRWTQFCGARLESPPERRRPGTYIAEFGDHDRHRLNPLASSECGSHFVTMSRKNRRILVLGAGVTGLTAAWALSKYTQNNILAIEKQPHVGGLATTMRVGDLSLDLGSHRLHNGYDAAVAQALQELCGTDLVRRPRNGMIYIQNKPVRYPPTWLDIVRAFGATCSVCFTLGLFRSRLGALLNSDEPDNFEDYTIQKLGRGLNEHFYKPYVEKLYG